MAKLAKKQAKKEKTKIVSSVGTDIWQLEVTPDLKKLCA